MKGKLVPALCNILGIFILLAVLGSALMLTVPRVLGYGVYNVVSGSMEPNIPVGSLIYVEQAQPEAIENGEVIAFLSAESVVTHRVVENRQLEGEFITKGDANQEEDLEPVPYANLVGRVSRHIPYLGELMLLYTSTIGKVYALCFAACGAMLNILAGRLRDRAKESDGDDS